MQKKKTFFHWTVLDFAGNFLGSSQYELAAQELAKKHPHSVVVVMSGTAFIDVRPEPFKPRHGEKYYYPSFVGQALGLQMCEQNTFDRESHFDEVCESLKLCFRSQAEAEECGKLAYKAIVEHCTKAV